MAGPLTLLTAPQITINGGGGSEGGGAPTLVIDPTTGIYTESYQVDYYTSIASSAPATAYVLGGQGPFTYQWAQLGSSEIQADTPTSNSTYFTYYGILSGLESSLWSVTVTDANAVTYSSGNITVTFNAV